MVAYEDDELIAFSTYLKWKKIKHYHIPNGKSRSIGEARKLKEMGTSPGICDFCIPIPNSKYHALYIEMKRKKGGVISSDQKEWIEFLNEVGNLAVVCFGCDEAIKVFEDYFNK